MCRWPCFPVAFLAIVACLTTSSCSLSASETASAFFLASSYRDDVARHVDVAAADAAVIPVVSTLASTAPDCWKWVVQHAEQTFRHTNGPITSITTSIAVHVLFPFITLEPIKAAPLPKISVRILALLPRHLNNVILMVRTGALNSTRLRSSDSKRSSSEYIINIVLIIEGASSNMHSNGAV